MEKYQTIKVLGDGTFGTVTKSINTENNELVAIKKMKKKFSNWEECRNLREVKSLIKLNHPNIMLLKEVLKVKDELYLVFEYCSENLYQTYENLKEKGKGFEEDQIQSIIFQIASALSYMHKHGFFHRDLKPENILVHRDKAKLADFGLAREVRSRPPYTDYVSTRWYRAPELLLKSENYNSPVDVFALGCIMAELYLSHPLFSGNSELDQMYKICSVLGTPTRESYPDGYKLASKIGFNFPSFNSVNLSSMIPNASPEAINLLTEMLKFDPQKRITASQVIQHPYFQNFSPDGILINDADPLPEPKKSSLTNIGSSTTTTSKPLKVSTSKQISEEKKIESNISSHNPFEKDGQVDLDLLEKNLNSSPLTLKTSMGTNDPLENLILNTQSSATNAGTYGSYGSSLTSSYSSNQINNGGNGLSSNLYRNGSLVGGGFSNNPGNNSSTNQYSNNKAQFGTSRTNKNSMIDNTSFSSGNLYGNTYTQEMEYTGSKQYYNFDKDYNLGSDNKFFTQSNTKQQTEKSPLKLDGYSNKLNNNISSSVTVNTMTSPYRTSPKASISLTGNNPFKNQENDALTELLNQNMYNKASSRFESSPNRSPYSNLSTNYQPSNFTSGTKGTQNGYGGYQMSIDDGWNKYK